VHGKLAHDHETLVRVHQPVSILDLLDTAPPRIRGTWPRRWPRSSRANCGVMVLLNCGESAEQLFAQFRALDAPQAKPSARAARWTCARTASARRS
jgi:3,4-dihydroxy 2-butanone 4-phosphate synthase/GTP cyclohydrolase II